MLAGSLCSARVCTSAGCSQMFKSRSWGTVPFIPRVRTGLWGSWLVPGLYPHFRVTAFCAASKVSPGWVYLNLGYLKDKGWGIVSSRLSQTKKQKTHQRKENTQNNDLRNGHSWALNPWRFIVDVMELSQGKLGKITSLISFLVTIRLQTRLRLRL